MSKLHSTSFPLTYWTLLQVRVDDEIQAQHARVLNMLNPVVVTVESKGHQERLADAKTQFIAGVTRLEALRLLALAMGAQLDSARYSVGVQSLASRIRFFEAIADFYAGVSANRPSRGEAEQALAQMQAAYASASKPSGGEWAATERGRLLGLTVSLPVLAAEDAGQFEATGQRMRNELASLRAQLDTLLATTMISLEVSPGSAELLADLGVTTHAEEPDSPPAAPEPEAPSA